VDRDADIDRYDGVVPSKCVLRDGDVVFSWSANLEVRIWDRGPAILNQHLFRVLPSQGIDPRWLRWVLHVVRDDFVELMHGSTMVHITQPMMKLVEVPVPDLETQRALAREADKVETESVGLATALRRQIDLLLERRQSLISSAVLGRLKSRGAAA
jgi:type I restriction enzyme S subunit